MEALTIRKGILKWALHQEQGAEQRPSVWCIKMRQIFNQQKLQHRWAGGQPKSAASLSVCTHAQSTMEIWENNSMQIKTSICYSYQDTADDMIVFRCVCWKPESAVILWRMYDFPACCFGVQLRPPHACLYGSGDCQWHPQDCWRGFTNMRATKGM